MYIDPNTGGVLFQALAGVVGVAVLAAVEAGAEAAAGPPPRTASP